MAAREEVSGEGEKTPGRIVTTSGMMAGGPVVEDERQLLPDARHRIVLAGYEDEGAPSRALRGMICGGGKRQVELVGEDGEPVKFEAALPAKEVSLYSHADNPGLVEYASQLEPRQIALSHGETGPQETL